MIESKEFSAKTVDQAIDKGLAELNLTKESADIEILSAGSILSKAKVRISPKLTPGAKAQAFLDKTLALMNVAAYVDLNETEDEAVLNIVGNDVSKLVGHRGETIDALQYLSSLVANADADGYRRIVLDSDNYREARTQRLEGIADTMAEKAVRMGYRIKLDPMNPYERRVIHAKLQTNEDVTTHSEGEEPNRYLVITPKKLKAATYEPRSNNYSDRRPKRDFNDRGGRGGYGGRPDNARGGYGGAPRPSSPRPTNTSVGSIIKQPGDN